VESTGVASSAIDSSALYSSLAVALLVMGIVLVITAIVLLIVLRIPNSIRVLTGGKGMKNIEYKKRPEDIEGKAVLSWNTSEILSRKESDSEATTLLTEETIVLDEASQNFKVEDDIMIVGTDKSV